jgi:hypothetical protein
MSAGVQNETCCGNKMRLGSVVCMRGANSLIHVRMHSPGRACWRGQSESVTRWRPAATRARLGSPLPPLARPRQQTALLPVFCREHRGFVALSAGLENSGGLSLILFPPAVSFCSRPDRKKGASNRDALGMRPPILVIRNWGLMFERCAHN